MYVQACNIKEEARMLKPLLLSNFFHIIPNATGTTDMHTYVLLAFPMGGQMNNDCD